MSAIKAAPGARHSQLEPASSPRHYLSVLDRSPQETLDLLQLAS